MLGKSYRLLLVIFINFKYIIMEKAKYVVLEHLELPDKGLRFWTINSNNNTYSYK